MEVAVECLNGLWYSHTLEYYTARRMNQMQLHTTLSYGAKEARLKRIHTQNPTYIKFKNRPNEPAAEDI